MKVSFRSVRMVLGALFLGLLANAVVAQDTVRVATIERKPFSFKVGDEWSGFSIELWQEIATSLNLEVEFVEKQVFGEMLDAVATGDVDLAAANISVTAAREKIMDFSQPIFDSGLLVLTSVDGRSNMLAVFSNPQLWSWVIGAIALFMLAGIGIAFLERRHQHFQDRDKISSFDEGLWWAVSVVTNASFTIFTPMSFLGRMLAYVLIIVGLFLVSAFVAQITASLTVQELRSQVSSFDDLRGKRVGTTSNSTSARFLTTQSVPFIGYDSLEEMFAALEANDLEAVVHDAPILAFFAATEGQGRFQTVGRVLRPEKYGLALPQGSALTEPINQELLRLREDGTFREITARWFGSDYN